ncbi:MAG: hypothetical protein MUF59_09755, partial [Candidatus Krumholzibacteria bacterium]|nr:hypothetical protein [Candidatus Krumholzibacteria bacterium]
LDFIQMPEKYPNIVEYSRTWRTFSDAEKQRNLPIIAIYITNCSDSNIVDNCHFSYIKGDVLRIRDNSNHIQFINNFVKISGWNAVVSEWFCNPFTQKCTKKGREKPSKGLLIAGNTIRGNWLYGYPTLYLDLQYRRTLNDVEHLKKFDIKIFNNDLSAMPAGKEEG